MRRQSLALLCCALLLVAVPQPALGQSVDKIRQEVEKIGISGKITVIHKDGRENYGSVAEIGTDTFEIIEVDLKQRMTIRYDELKKVRANYGGRGFGGKRPNPRTGLIVGIALVGGLIALLAAVGGGS